MVRGSGLLWDIRLIEPYDSYNLSKFFIPTGIFGDCYDRYMIRVEEMRESSFIILQCLNLIKILSEGNDYSYMIDDYKIAPPPRALMKYNMGALIHHFKYY